jgi:hypothetical protein
MPVIICLGWNGGGNENRETEITTTGTQSGIQGRDGCQTWGETNEEARAVETFEKISSSASFEADQGSPRLLKVIHLRPKSQGGRVGRPRSVLHQPIPGLPQLAINH